MPNIPDLWSTNHPLQNYRYGEHVLRYLRVTALTWHNFWKDECLVRGTALAYGTLLSIVPLMALALSLSVAFPGVGDARGALEDMIFSYLATGANEEVIDAINGFIQNVHSGALAGFGIMALMVAAVLVLSAIEEAFNKIWNVEVPRTYTDRFTRYLATVIIGPILLTVSLRTFAMKIIAEFDALDIGMQLPFLRRTVVPFVASWMAISVVYVLMPNTRVKWRAGLVGGFVGGLLFELANWGYRLYATNAITYSKIYGAVGAIPVFLIWLYVVWLVVLFGAEFSHAAQTVELHQRKMILRNDSQWLREKLAAMISVESVRKFIAGEPGLTRDDVCTRYNVPGGMAEAILTRLSNHEVLTSSQRGYVPARDPRDSTLADVVDALRGTMDGTENSEPVNFPDDPELDRVFEDLRASAHEGYSAITLDELARRGGPQETSA